MSDLSPRGALREGWSAEVGDYAIAGAWAHRGEVLVVGDAAGGIYGFEGKSGTPLWHGNHDGGLMAMAIHPEGRVFATAGQDGCVRLWSAAEGQVHHVVELGRGWVENVAWSSDGQALAASLSRRVHVCDADGEQVWQSEDHPSTVSAIAWSGARELATACYGRVAFFNTASGEIDQTLEWKGSLVSMVLSPDGDVVACGSQDNTVHFWRRSTGNGLHDVGVSQQTLGVGVRRHGHPAGHRGGEAVLVWSFEGDGPEGTRPGVLELHVQPLTTLAFARRGMRLASGGRDGAVVVWSLNPDGQGGAIGAALVEEGIAELAWRPDGRSLAALDAKGGVTVWRVKA